MQPPDGGSGGQPSASVDCALFAGSRNAVVRSFARHGRLFELRQGMSLRVLARVSLWDRTGRFQLKVVDIDPTFSDGEGRVRLRELVDRLRPEGVLDANGELPMPRLPLRVGLVTARDSAACSDFLHGLRESGYPFQVWTAWALMQGSGTRASVISALNGLLSVPDLDVAVLTRGGGSATDLGWFDDEHIARTIAQLPWPVISGIGHETDTTLPDFAAHTRAKTPTHAADILVDRAASAEEDLRSLSSALQVIVGRRVAEASSLLSSMAADLQRSASMRCRGSAGHLDTLARWISASAGSRLRAADGRLQTAEAGLLRALETGVRASGGRARLDELTERLVRCCTDRIGSARRRLDSAGAVLAAGDPARLRARGWATLRKQDGGLVGSCREVSPGDRLVAELSDGEAETEVLEVRPRSGGEDSILDTEDDADDR